MPEEEPTNGYPLDTGEIPLGVRPAITLQGDPEWLLHGLILHKAAIAGSWTQWLVRHVPDEEFRRVLGGLMAHSVEEASRTIPAIQQWSEIPGSRAAARESAEHVQNHFVHAMRELKSHSTEAYLLAAMRAPTEEIRRQLLYLADIDRMADDKLRRLLGRPTIPDQRRQIEEVAQGAPLGAHEGAGDASNLSTRIRETLQKLRDAGHPPGRLVLSATALRHLRDEGVVDAAHGTVLGVRADVDFGWAGDCFSITTADRASLSEIYTSTHAEKQDRI